MTKKSSFQGISKISRGLLSTGENKNVDYKVNVKGLHADDLVAFANSKDGGSILIGVRETSGQGGTQKGEPVGHPVDDASKLQIMSKALACSPPIQIEIFIENLGDCPFFRVEVPSGTHKPYSTANGTYKIREDGRNSSLLSEPLLRIFLEREGAVFKSRFAEATKNLEDSMTAALGLVENLEHVISMKIEEIGFSLNWAEDNAGDAARTIEMVRNDVFRLADETKKQSQRIKAIIRKVEADDPVKQKLEEGTLESIIQKLKENPALVVAIENGEKLSFSVSGQGMEDLDQADLDRLLTMAIDKLKSEKIDE